MYNPWSKEFLFTINWSYCHSYRTYINTLAYLNLLSSFELWKWCYKIDRFISKLSNKLYVFLFYLKIQLIWIFKMFSAQCSFLQFRKKNLFTCQIYASVYAFWYSILPYDHIFRAFPISSSNKFQTFWISMHIFVLKD